MVSKLSPLKKIWKTVIGLEIHAQLNCNTKLFSVAPNTFNSSPNSNVAYFDMAMPGTLPIINSKCVELAILAATVLKCEIDYASEFDRKHYFYGDMPNGYQITQYRKPIAKNGLLRYFWNSYPNSNSPNDIRKSEVRISEIHLEQDSGKSLHDYNSNLSMIDLNRAGIGLLEVVTDCQFDSSLAAVGFLRELKELFFESGICTGKMEEGELRVDANISVQLAGSERLGERTEIKNINSLKGVSKAIDFEFGRQISLLESGLPVVNETRYYDPILCTTVSMRDKEGIQDYRYMPEPNLPPVHLQRQCTRLDDRISCASTCVPCIQKRLRDFVYSYDKRDLLLSQYSMSLSQANTVLSESGFYEWLLEVYKCAPSDMDVDLQCSWLTNLRNISLSQLLGELRIRNSSIITGSISPVDFAELVTMVNLLQINIAKITEILRQMLDQPGKSPRLISYENHWQQINDPELIEKIVRDFVKTNPKALHDFKSGNKRVDRFFKKQIRLQRNDTLNNHILDRIILQVLNED